MTPNQHQLCLALSDCLGLIISPRILEELYVQTLEGHKHHGMTGCLRDADKNLRIACEGVLKNKYAFTDVEIVALLNVLAVRILLGCTNSVTDDPDPSRN